MNSFCNEITNAPINITCESTFSTRIMINAVGKKNKEEISLYAEPVLPLISDTIIVLYTLRWAIFDVVVKRMTATIALCAFHREAATRLIVALSWSVLLSMPPSPSRALLHAHPHPRTRAPSRSLDGRLATPARPPHSRSSILSTWLCATVRGRQMPLLLKRVPMKLHLMRNRSNWPNIYAFCHFFHATLILDYPWLWERKDSWLYFTCTLAFSADPSLATLQFTAK
jgi:hypothetical protein